MRQVINNDNLIIRLPASMKDNLRDAAAGDDRKVAEVIREMIREYLDTHSSKDDT